MPGTNHSYSYGAIEAGSGQIQDQKVSANLTNSTLFLAWQTVKATRKTSARTVANVIGSPTWVIMMNAVAGETFAYSYREAMLASAVGTAVLMGGWYLLFNSIKFYHTKERSWQNLEAARKGNLFIEMFGASPAIVAFSNLLGNAILGYLNGKLDAASILISSLIFFSGIISGLVFSLLNRMDQYIGDLNIPVLSGDFSREIVKYQIQLWKANTDSVSPLQFGMNMLKNEPEIEASTIEQLIAERNQLVKEVPAESINPSPAALFWKTHRFSPC